MSRLLSILAALSALMLAGCPAPPPPLLTNLADVKADEAMVIFRSRGITNAGDSKLFRNEPDTYWGQIDVPGSQRYGFNNKAVGNKYEVYKLPAGTYELGYTEWRGSAVIYRYHTTQARFTAKAGEVAYVGDLEFRRGYDTFLVDVVDEQANAAAFLAKAFPELRNRLVTRLTEVREKTPEPSRNKYCYGIWPVAWTSKGPC